MMTVASHFEHGRTTQGADHDHGLEHNHHWARERFAMHGASGRHPRVADAASIPTTSIAFHDDIQYFA